jgi:phage terminase large subunit
MLTGPLFIKLRNCRKKKIVNQGGTSSGKTVTILQVLACIACEEKGVVITVVGQDVPNLKKGAIRDWQNYVANDPEIASRILSFNKTDRIVEFKNGSIIEFNAYGDEQDAKSGKRDYLFINEANGINYMVYWQLAIRTKKQVFIDYNPNSAFWVHEKLLGMPDVQLYVTDHRHNPFLSEEQHHEIENIGDPELWAIYARGKTGKVKGLIFGHFKPIDRIPADIDRFIWGIDYGYTNDPTALVKVGVKGRQRFHQECCYEPGISATRLREIWLLYGGVIEEPIYSEADPNMINQLRILGMPVYPAIKGPGSLIASISKVREMECYYTADSINFDKEVKAWKWMMAEDVQTGKTVMTNVPIDGHDHCCAASRYANYTDHFRVAA